VVLDVATGTAAVALELVRQTGCSVVGVDQSPEMLDEARRRLLLAAETKRVRLVEASAQELPFEDGSFDGLTAAYLLRYLDDLPTDLGELARVLRPGATAALLDFGVPPGPSPRAPGISGSTSACPCSAARSRPAGTRSAASSAAASATSTGAGRCRACSTALREAGFDDVRGRGD
jgi:ubiquinone/menaquinone biosynthesis C-methylase UbiE